MRTCTPSSPKSSMVTPPCWRSDDGKKKRSTLCEVLRLGCCAGLSSCRTRSPSRSDDQRSLPFHISHQHHDLFIHRPARPPSKPLATSLLCQSWPHACARELPGLKLKFIAQQLLTLRLEQPPQSQKVDRSSVAKRYLTARTGFLLLRR